MNRRYRSFVWLCVLPMVFLVFSGCASYEPAKSSGPAATNEPKGKEIVARDGSVEVHLVPLFDKERAQPYLGIDPAQSKTMPVLLRVVNNGDEPVKVELQDSCLLVGEDEQWRTLSLPEAIDRALRSDAAVVGWGIGFGLIGWMVAADGAAGTNRTLEQDYHAKYFKPTLINAGASGQGVVFFDVPRKGKCHIAAAVVRVRRLNADTYSDIRLAAEEDVLVRR
jgi:hypothetical protein